MPSLLEWSHRVPGALVARAKRVRKVVWQPLERSTVHAARSVVAEIGSNVLPPWRCPGCGSWRKQRRLARCAGIITTAAHRQLAFATGCSSCGLLYAAPFPPATHFDTLYSEDGEWADTHARSSDATASERLVALVDNATGFRTPSPGSRVLDFGCGHGRWLNTFASFGWDTYGIDPSLKTAFTRHKELHDAGSEPTFDFVILSHVLEHLPKPGDVLRSLGRATRPDGWVYVAVPGLDSLPEHRDWKYILSATHVAAFSVSCLTVLLGRAGFGAPMLIKVPKDDKAGFRLRLVARKTGSPAAVHKPLEPAIAALKGAGLLGKRSL